MGTKTIICQLLIQLAGNMDGRRTFKNWLTKRLVPKAWIFLN
jgi:hypothetical protein